MNTQDVRVTQDGTKVSVRQQKSRSQPLPDESGRYSFVDAAQILMEEKRAPVHYAELTKEAIKRKLIATEAKAPSIGMYAAISNEIWRRSQTGRPQRFTFVGAGQFALADIAVERGHKQEKTVFEKVSESRSEACRLLYEKLTSANMGDHFELIVSDLLRQMGYDEVEVIGGKDDQGVDIVCSKRDGISKVRIAVQCKCKGLNKEVGPKDISTLRDNLSTYQCQSGVVVTTSKLNQAARDKAVESGKERVHYIEHDELMDLFAQHKVGLKGQPVEYFQIDSDRYEFLK